MTNTFDWITSIRHDNAGKKRLLEIMDQVSAYLPKLITQAHEITFDGTKQEAFICPNPAGDPRFTNKVTPGYMTYENIKHLLNGEPDKVQEPLLREVYLFHDDSDGTNLPTDWHYKAKS